MAEEMHIEEWPELRNPVLLVGVGGWTNAGETATGALAYLKDRLKAKKFGWFNPDEFYQYTISRPNVSVDEGRIRSFIYPTTELYAWTNPDREQDLVILVGPEPDLRWQRYVALVLEVAKKIDAKILCAIGSFYDSVPHTRDILCRGTATDAAVLERLKELQVEPSAYVGPTGLSTALIQGAGQADIPAFSLWGRSPHYVQISNPHVWHAVLWRALAACQLSLDVSPLIKRSVELQEQVNRAMNDNSELREHVKQLEAIYDATRPLDALEPQEPLHQDDILRSVEDFFREPGPGEPR